MFFGAILGAFWFPFLKSPPSWGGFSVLPLLVGGCSCSKAWTKPRCFSLFRKKCGLKFAVKPMRFFKEWLPKERRRVAEIGSPLPRVGLLCAKHTNHYISRPLKKGWCCFGKRTAAEILGGTPLPCEHSLQSKKEFRRMNYQKMSGNFSSSTFSWCSFRKETKFQHNSGKLELWELWDYLSQQKIGNWPPRAR